MKLEKIFVECKYWCKATSFTVNYKKLYVKVKGRGEGQISNLGGMERLRVR